ncbi:unnamed protein product [Parascedosporium putredinis]|uniref:JmjC domain-containing protein n=1 Tax=Parascedosporium putredinis TaxID=1442378 RepID=A0A9P1MC02_9PEZI|nr:unnamed protein product [Parascedosporium putredinis]CAI7996775.1 unnamed protein product [Parascedosporium putredinis]
MALQQRIPTVEAADVSPVQTSASPAIAALNFAASFHRDAEACRNARDRELLYENYRDKILAIDTFAANVAAAFLPFLRVAASRRDSDAGRWEDFNRLARRGKATRDRASQHLQHQSGVIAAWGLECFQHYGWQALPLPLLRQLHDLAVLMPRWDDVVNLLNSKMLARHELRVLRGKNNALRVGEHSAASKVQDSRSPQLKKSTLVIGGSPIKKFGLKRDHYGMVVPSTISTSGSDNEQSDGDEDVDDQSDGDEDMNDQSEEDDDDISEKSDVNKDMNDQSDGDSDIDDYDISPPSPKRAKLSAAEPTHLSHASVSDGGSPSRTADSLPDHRIGTLPRQESEARADKTPPQPDAPPLLAPQARLSRSDGNQPIPIPIHMAAPTETQPSEAGGGNDSPPPRPPTLLQTLQQSYAADIRQLVHHLKQPHASDEVQRQRQLQLDWLDPQRWASVYAEPEHQLGGSSVASPSDADVWYLSSDSFHRYAEDGYIFRRPVVVKQQFQDSSMYDIAEYIDMLWQRFPEQQIEVQNSATGAFSLMSMKDYCLTATKVDLNSFDAITPISNATNLHRLARADEPVLSRLPRFRLLSTLADRVAGTVGRSRHLGQNDMGDHLAFNTLSFTGAHARPHVDALGGCWVRCLAGLQVWGFATNLDADDWERFQTDRCNWSPQGKGRLIVMEQDDVLFVPPGLRVIQVTFALEPCLMEGGLLWDECAIPEILDELLWNAKRPERRSEPNSFQLRAVVDALEKWFNEENCVYPSPPLAATALETGIQSAVTTVRQ